MPSHLHSAFVRLFLEGHARLLERLARSIHIPAVESNVPEPILLLQMISSPGTFDYDELVKNIYISKPGSFTRLISWMILEGVVFLCVVVVCELERGALHGP